MQGGKPAFVVIPFDDDVRLFPKTARVTVPRFYYW
jgi:hypothetical protein